jgi:hypothetical protein
MTSLAENFIFFLTLLVSVLPLFTSMLCAKPANFVESLYLCAAITCFIGGDILPIYSTGYTKGCGFGYKNPGSMGWKG